MLMCMFICVCVFSQSEVKNNEVLNSATQMTPRTIDGMKTRQVPRGSVLPIGINPRAGILLPPCIYTSTMWAVCMYVCMYVYVCSVYVVSIPKNLGVIKEFLTEDFEQILYTKHYHFKSQLIEKSFGPPKH